MAVRFGSYSKYKNKKSVVDGISFDSQKELIHYGELKLLLRAKKISNLECHPKFELQQKFLNDQGKTERAITYSADFSYNDEHGKIHVEDVKGHKTKEYRLKRKLFLFKYRGLYLFEEI